PKFLDLAEKNATDSVALDALIWVVTNTGRNPAAKDDVRSKAVAILLRDHSGSDRMGQLCQNLARGDDKESLALLRGILDKNANKEVQAEASLALAQRLSNTAQTAQHLKNHPELVKDFEQYYGKPYVEELLKADVAKVEGEAEKIFTDFANKFAADMKPERVA